MAMMKSGRARMARRREPKPRTQRAVLIPVALILAAAAVAGTIGAFRADHRRGDERPAVVARIRVAGTPSAIAAGRHAIWVLSAATLSRIDPQTNRLAGTVRIPGGLNIPGWGDAANDVAVTRDAVWVAVFGKIANGKVHGGSLVRVDPGTMQVVARLPISGIVGLESGLGSLWANQVGVYPRGPSPDRPNKGSVYRVDPSTNEVHAVLTDAFLTPQMLVAGGFVWVYDLESGVFERVDPGTGSVSRMGSEPLSDGALVFDSLAYADGGLWFPDRGAGMSPVTGPLSVRRLDVSTGDIRTIPLGISGTIKKTPRQIEHNVGLHLVAADANSVWLMVANQTWKGNSGARYWSGRLIRIELTTGRVQAVTIGAYAPDGVIADGDLWLADSQHHTVLRVEP